MTLVTWVHLTSIEHNLVIDSEGAKHAPARGSFLPTISNHLPLLLLKIKPVNICQLVATEPENDPNIIVEYN